MSTADESKAALAARNIEFGLVLRRDRRTAAAENCFRQALELCPDNLEARYHLAHLLERTNRPAEAAPLITQRAQWKEDARLDIVAARVERRLGRSAEAIARLESIDSSRLGPTEQAAIHYELGQLHDQQGASTRAFEYFETANRLFAQLEKARDFDKRAFFSTLYPIEDPRLWSRPWFESWQPGPATVADTKAPIFVIGFPRSGTTLIAQILGSHPQLQTTISSTAALRMRQYVDTNLGSYPAALPALTAEQIESLRQAYEDQVAKQVQRRPGAILVDTFAYNLMLVPLILRVSPMARFVLVIRHPYDACLSAFMQNFAPSPATIHYTTLADTAQAYARTMTFWNDIVRVYDLDARTHTIHYEQMVADFEPQVRALLRFLDVPWDVAVTRFDRYALTQGEIETPSYHQVAQPIYADSVHRWRNYATQIAPIIDVLRPFAERFGY